MCRGPPKKRLKKAAQTNSETSLVVATRMQFPYNEKVQQAEHRKGKKAAKETASSTSISTRYHLQFSLYFH
jgi:hypothetical protein